MTVKKENSWEKPGFNKRKDWEGIKIQYFKSPILEVKKFMTSIGMSMSGTAQQRTKGWTKEKEELLKKVNKEAEKKVVQSMTDQRARLLSNMEKAKISGLNELAIRLTKNVKSMNVATIGGIVSIFNKETELDTERVDNTSAIKALRGKIEAAEREKKCTGKSK